MNYGNENNIVIIPQLKCCIGTEAIHNSAAVYQQAVIPHPSKKNSQSTVYYKCRQTKCGSPRGSCFCAVVCSCQYFCQWRIPFALFISDTLTDWVVGHLECLTPVNAQCSSFCQRDTKEQNRKRKIGINALLPLL